MENGKIFLNMDLKGNFTVISSGEPSKFSSNFISPVRLSNGSSMALKNIHYGEIKNVSSKNNKFFIVVDTIVNGDPITRNEAVYIPQGRYNDIGELLSAMTRSMNESLETNYLDYPLQNNNCTLTYVMISNKWTLKLPTRIILEKTNREPNLTDFFSFPMGEYNSIQVPSETLPETHHLGFLYCSVIENSYINTRSSRLMATIPLKSRSGFSSHEYFNPYYYSIAIRDFAAIEFELRNGDGDLIEFVEKAYIVLNLHMKTSI